MSTRQLARTVKEGRKVTFHIPTREPITGYLSGWDDFHWMVITPDGHKHLVHKTGVTLDLHDNSTFDKESNKDELEKVVGPFRKRIESEFFGSQSKEVAR